MRFPKLAFAQCVLLFLLATDVWGQPSLGNRGWIDSLTEPGNGLAIRRTSPQTGLPTFTSSPGRGILLQVAPGASAESRGRAFVDVYGKAFGLGSAEQVRLTRSHIDDLGVEHVRFQQVHRGVPVTGGELLIHLEGPRVMVANGHTLADLPEDVLPIVPGELAQSAARRLIAKRRPADAIGARYSEPRLEILNRSLLSGVGQDASRLAWFIEASGERLREFIWVDARSGAILLSFSQLTDAKNRTVYSAGNNNILPGTLVRSEGGPATGDPDSDNAYTFAGVTYDYFLSQHGRDSYDGAGAAIISSTHYCVPPDDCPNYANAFWNGTQMVYGNGYASADDVVGHELAHAVTERTAGLFYYQQSGALNESFSDIFGETIDLVSSVGVGNDTAGVRWQMGEDLVIGSIRSMMNPGLFGDPARMNDANFVCSTSGWTDPASDHGGVHSNSGVPNHAFALMVDGGSFNGRAVTGIGLTKAAKIQYRALASYLFSGSGFLDDYDAINQSCRDLIGTAGITTADCTQVQNALEAVEMHLPWGCAGSTLPPAMCPSGQRSVVFSDGFEVANNNWMGSSAGGSGGTWMFDRGLARTGSGMAYGNDPEGISIHSLFTANAVVVPTGGRLYFDHLFEFENDQSGNYDGGRIQYSTDNGTTWLDANSLIDGGHSYDGLLTASNPLGAGTAFVGASYGYTGTRLNLAALAGQGFRFRFVIGTDEFVSSLGWLVDNFAIYSCVTPAAFTDDPLVPGTTPIKAVHITELRTRINAIRLARGLPQIVWTNPITAGLIVQALDITGMRTALSAAYTAAALTPPTYTDPALGAGTAIKAIHIAELRAAVLAIE